jgi:hypothetical protein
MTMTQLHKTPVTLGQFEKNAELRREPVFSEIMHFLMRNKKWWLLPVVAMLLILGLLVVLGGTAVAPFVYTLF